MLPASEHTSSIYTILWWRFTSFIKSAGGEEETFPNSLGKLCQDLTFWLRAPWLCHTTATPCSPPALTIMCLESDPAFPTVTLVSAGDKLSFLLTCSLLCRLLSSFGLKKRQRWCGAEAEQRTCTVCQHGICNILAKVSLVVAMRQNSIIRNTKGVFLSSALEAGSKLSPSMAFQLPACVVPRSKSGDVHMQNAKKKKSSHILT